MQSEISIYIYQVLNQTNDLDIASTYHGGQAFYSTKVQVSIGKI